MNILSIQSHVVFGHVGNGSAVFPLQRLGAEVWPIDTVQFSNHPGYGGHAGVVTPPGVIRALVDGIEARGVLPGCDAVLSGYVGDPGTGNAILHAAERVRAANAAALWCCDPVIGDDGPGIYVRPGVAAFFRERAVPRADLLTPNQFELACLTGMDCGTWAGVVLAVAALQGRMRVAGPRVVLVTSVRTGETPDGWLDMLCVDGAGRRHRLRTERLAIAANGAGDAVAALFLFHVLQGGDAAAAMAAAGSAVHGLLSRTLAAGSRELLLVAAQEEFVQPTRMFAPECC